MSALAKVNEILSYVDDNKDSEASNNDYSSLNGRFEVGYWKIRGLGEPARLMLGYRDVTFKNTTYEQEGEEGNFSRDKWTSVKPTLGFEFPNLPYLIDTQNGLKITESRAIYRYLARCLNIGTFVDPQQARQEMLSDIVADTASIFPNLCYRFAGMKIKGLDYSKEFEDAKTDYLKGVLPRALDKFEKHFENNKNSKFLSGNQLCVADFQFWQFLDQNLNLDSTILDKYPRLLQFEKDFQNVPTIAKFLKEHPAANYPMNNKASVFGCHADHNTREKRTSAK